MVGRPGGKEEKQEYFWLQKKILFRGMSLPGGYTDYNPLEGIGSNQHLAVFSLFAVLTVVDHLSNPIKTQHQGGEFIINAFLWQTMFLNANLFFSRSPLII